MSGSDQDSVKVLRIKEILSFVDVGQTLLKTQRGEMKVMVGRIYDMKVMVESNGWSHGIIF